MAHTKADKKKQGYDVVKTMRDIRDRMSRKIVNMTFAEEKAYLKSLMANNQKPVEN